MGILKKKKSSIDAAVAHRRAGDPHAAIDVLAEILTATPDDVPATVEMARALRLIGDPVGAEEHIRIALAAVLDYTLTVELAGVLAEQGRVVEAEQTLDAALFMADANPRLDPGEALIVRATIAHAQGRADDARTALDQIVPKRASKTTKRYAALLQERITPANGSAERNMP